MSDNQKLGDLEKKLQRLKEIHKIITEGSISLDNEFVLVKEATKLGKEVSLSLEEMQNYLMEITNIEENKSSETVL